MFRSSALVFALMTAANFLHAGEWKIALQENIGVNYYSPLAQRGFDYMFKCDENFRRTQFPEFSGINLPSKGKFPGLQIDYVKNFNYCDAPAYRADLPLDKALDLFDCKRMTGRLTTIAGHGYYSGRWHIELTDKNGKKAQWCIGKEAWRFRDGWDFELPLSGAPKGFDYSRIVNIAFIGYAPVNAHRGMIKLENLNFDRRSPGENELKRKTKFTAAMAKLAALQVRTAPPEKMIFPDTLDFAGESSSYHLRSARGGADDLQLVILPGNNPPGKIALKAEDFTGKNGKKINSSAVKFYEVLFVPTLPEKFDALYEGNYPDILRPLNEKNALYLPLAPNRVTVIWVKVTIPRNADAGVYSGKITVAGVEKNLTLTVDDFTMPLSPTLRTSFWLFPNRIPRKNPAKPLSFEEIKPWANAALEAKMTPILTTENVEDEPFTITPQPDGSYKVDLSAWKNYYHYVMNNGGNAIHLADTHWFGRRFFALPKAYGFTGETPADLAKNFPDRVAPHRKQIFKSYMEQAMAFVKANHWEKAAYLQLWDEPNAQAVKKALPVVYGTAHELIPEIPLALTKTIPPELTKFIRVPIPSIPAVDNGYDGGKGYSSNARAAGRRPWVYSCVSYGLTLTEVPVRNRLLPLYCFAGNVEGYLFWALNYYDIAKVRDFPARPWGYYRSATGVKEAAGDGIMLYPPEPGSDEPMPSCRMMLWRSGMDDYEYLVELRRLFMEKGEKLSGEMRSRIAVFLDIRSMLLDAWENPSLPAALRAEAGNLIKSLKEL